MHQRDEKQNGLSAVAIWIVHKKRDAFICLFIYLFESAVNHLQLSHVRLTFFLLSGSDRVLETNCCSLIGREVWGRGRSEHAFPIITVPWTGPRDPAIENVKNVFKKKKKKKDTFTHEIEQPVDQFYFIFICIFIFIYIYFRAVFSHE